MKLVAQVKLLASSAQAALLEQTLRQAHAACNFLAAIAWEEQVFGRYALHKLAYYRTRAAFPALAAQVLIRCIARVADAYKLNRQHPCHFTPRSALAYDDRILRWYTDQSTVSIWASDGDVYSGAAVEQKRRSHTHRRRNLQKKGTKAAKRKLRRLAGKQARFQKDTNHRIAKRVVHKAQVTSRAIAVEDLTGIRERTTVSRRQRARHANWAFFQLRQFIAYKAQRAGVTVIPVDPRHTSQTCPVCGHVARANRRTQALFSCIACGYSAPADYNAAQNIRARAIVNRPMVSTPHQGEGQAPPLAVG
jgi:IS605 OrfB family transposase